MQVHMCEERNVNTPVIIPMDKLSDMVMKSAQMWNTANLVALQSKVAVRGNATAP